MSVRHRYRVSARHGATAWLGMVTPTPEMLGEVISDCVLQRCERIDSGYELDVRLDRPTHQDAIIEIADAVERVGLYAVEMYVTEMLKREAAAAVGASLGAVGVGGATRNALGALAGGFLGGALADALAEHVGIPVARYHATRVGYEGRWGIARIDGWLPGPQPAQ